MYHAWVGGGQQERYSLQVHDTQSMTGGDGVPGECVHDCW